MTKMKTVLMLMKCPKEIANRYNGYVAFDKSCPWYFDGEEVGCDDYEIIECNGGITFAANLKRDDLKPFKIIEGNPEELDEDIIVIGFDTCHAWDRDWIWPKKRVIEECRKIINQLEELKPYRPLKDI